MYYYPHTNIEYESFQDYKWMQSEECQSRLCQDCNGVGVSWSGKPFDIQVKVEPAVFCAGHRGAEIVPTQYAKFLKSLDLDNKLVWGRLLIGDERSVSTRFETVYMPSMNGVNIRGDASARYWVCSGGCGRIRTEYEGDGVGYLLRHHQIGNFGIIGGRMFIVLSKDVLFQHDWDQYSGIEFQRIPILECPLDGFRLPGDPDWSKVCPGFTSNLRKSWERK